jgi:hypothetical protein
MFHDGKPRFPKSSPHRIADLVAIVEHTGRLQFLKERSFAQSVGIEILCIEWQFDGVGSSAEADQRESVLRSRKQRHYV